MPEKTKEQSIRSVGEFAQHLGLSRWTVSRILNGHPGVKEGTRQRVLAEMSRLNFQPNVLARSLRGAKTGLLGVCFQEIESPILSRKISFLQHSLRARGLRAVMEVTSGIAEAERDIINHFLSLQVDGVILIGTVLEADDPILARLAEAKMPAVTVDAAHDIPLPRVELDRHLAMLLCLRHLQQRGRKRFALLGLESDPVYGARRMEGLQQASQKLGFSWADDFVSLRSEGQSKWSYEYGYALAQQLLQMEDPPRGVIALNDRVAVGAMKAIREWGYAIPSDFSLVGFDNLDLGQWIEPALTSIGQSVQELIEDAVELLSAVSVGEHGHSVPLKRVAPELVVRGST